MKKHLLISFLACLYISITFSQPNRKIQPINPPPVSSQIIWGKIVEQHIPATGKRSILTFYNSQYDFNKHLFPIYSERIKLPESSSNVDIELYNESYLPLNDSEMTAISSYDIEKRNFITSDIKPFVTISFHKKEPYAFVQFIPIRKNKISGIYEKMISFSLRVNPTYTHKYKST